MKKLCEGDVVGLGLVGPFVVDDGVEVYLPIGVWRSFFLFLLFEECLGRVFTLHLFSLASQSLHVELEEFLVCALVVRVLHY
jgi:hypothetical protein